MNGIQIVTFKFWMCKLNPGKRDNYASLAHITIFDSLFVGLGGPAHIVLCLKCVCVCVLNMQALFWGTAMGTAPPLRRVFSHGRHIAPVIPNTTNTTSQATSRWQEEPYGWKEKLLEDPWVRVVLSFFACPYPAGRHMIYDLKCDFTVKHNC